MPSLKMKSLNVYMIKFCRR